MTFKNFAKTALCRVYQTAAFIPRAVFTHRERAMLKGTGSIKKLPVYIRKKNIDKVMVVTDTAIRKSGVLVPIYEKLIENNIMCSEYSCVGTKPTYLMAERCAQRYIQEGCNAIIAVGSGSVIDCAKLAGVKAASPKTDLALLDGCRLILGKTPPLFAVPTTVGTGSETSACAVHFDKKQKIARIVTSPALRPDASVLDPMLTETLPKEILAHTAMSALCRAVETYVETTCPKKERDNAALAVRLIFLNLRKAYNDNDSDARIELQKAAYLAGRGVGYAHCSAAAISAMYRTSYAPVAAAILPKLLRAYGEKAHKRLAYLARHLKIKGETDAEKAEQFIKTIEKMNAEFSVPAKTEQLKKSGIPKIAKNVSARCNPSYPAPKQLFREEICEVLFKLN